MVLSINLYLNNTPLKLVTLWFSGLCCISIIRLAYSKFALNNKKHALKINTCFLQFSLLTFVTGVIWGSSYLIFLPYITTNQEFIIILVLGGMSAGGMASLSVYMPAFYCFLLPIFFPVIAYNFYIFELNEITAAIMITLFTIMLIVTAKVNSNLLKKNLHLGEEKNKLITDLKESNDKLEHSIEAIRKMSITDYLTGLYNRRHFNAMIQNEFNRAKRNKHNLILVLIDIDNFKYINDTYGHPYGDNFLIEVARLIKNTLKRANDTLFRLGGDEFAILLANLSLDDALTICTDIQRAFKKNTYKDLVSLSMGVISIESIHSANVENLISIADVNLYEAKKQGKNKVISNNVLPNHK
jgi:diguanylate cyclase (GGDEF)-like protein